MKPGWIRLLPFKKTVSQEQYVDGLLWWLGQRFERKEVERCAENFGYDVRTSEVALHAFAEELQTMNLFCISLALRGRYGSETQKADNCIELLYEKLLDLKSRSGVLNNIPAFQEADRQAWKGKLAIKYIKYLAAYKSVAESQPGPPQVRAVRDFAHVFFKGVHGEGEKPDLGAVMHIFAYFSQYLKSTSEILKKMDFRL